MTRQRGEARAPSARVRDVQHLVTAPCYLQVMGHDHDGLPQVLAHREDEAKHLMGEPPVKGAGRLVGKDDVSRLEHAAGNGDTLLLAPREDVDPGPLAALEAHRLKRTADLLCLLGAPVFLDVGIRALEFLNPLYYYLKLAAGTLTPVVEL